MTQELVKFSMEPKTLEEAMKYAELIAKSSLVPKDFVNQPGNVLVAIQMGQEIGLKPLQALQNIAVINGRPCLWGDAVLALVRGSGLLEDFREDFDEPTQTASCSAKRRGQPTIILRRFGMDDAKKAGLWGKQGTWQTYPRRMMQMRARAFALRDGFADVLKGLAIAEEQGDVIEADGQEVTTALPPPPVAPRRLSQSEGPTAPTVNPIDAELIAVWKLSIQQTTTLDELKTVWDNLIAQPAYLALSNEQKVALRMTKDERKDVLTPTEDDPQL